jgi:hypothetical protein
LSVDYVDELLDTSKVAKLRVLLVLLLSSSAFASDFENPMFGYTHMLPSPFTLPAGRFVLGTDTAFGVTSFLQVSTNVVGDLYQFYNVQAEVSLYDDSLVALAVNLGYETYNIDSLSAAFPSQWISAWLPGAVAGFALAPPLALFLGGNLVVSGTDLSALGAQGSGFVHGAMVESDVSWNFYRPKKARVGYVLSAGVSYDASYQLWGYGLSVHIPHLHVGFHYYPQATYYPLQPILAGGAAFDL